MKKETIKKEQLTPERIKRDLKGVLRKQYIELAVTSVLLGLLLFAFFAAFSLFSVMMRIYYLAVFVAIICAEVWMVIRLVRLHRAISGKGSIVQDKLIRAEEIEHYSRHRGRYSVYWLHFSGYGSYTVPDENYTWSNTYSMSAAGVYHYALNGDEFYLVLSKPHTGKILMAYNCKLFEKPEDLL